MIHGVPVDFLVTLTVTVAIYIALWLLFLDPPGPRGPRPT